MYVTAHRVVSPTSSVEGINSFLYMHGPYTWQGLPPTDMPESNPGSLVAKQIAVPPPGNRVRSYLDVVAPDEAPWAEVRQSFIRFMAEAQRESFPWKGVEGCCLFRIGLEVGLAAEWRREIAFLFRAAEALRTGRT
jgi:hypothetical protein